MPSQAITNTKREISQTEVVFRAGTIQREKLALYRHFKSLKTRLKELEIIEQDREFEALGLF